MNEITMGEAFYLGRKVNEKKLVEAKSRVIDADEEIFCVIKGRLTRGVRKRGERGEYAKGLLFLTNKRIIFYVKQLLFGRYEEIVFPYGQINSVYSKKGVIGDRVDIAAISDAVTIDYIPKGDGKIVVGKIREMMEMMKKPQVVVQNTAPTVDIADQIEKLANLKDRGILSEEEFEHKKTELLEKL